MMCTVFPRRAFGDALSAVACALLLCGCHSETVAVAPPAPAAVPAPPAAVPAPTGTPSPSAAPEPEPVATPAPTPAARYCGSGQHPVPLSGLVEASLVPNTEPTVLSPEDTGFHLYEGAVWLNGAVFFSDFLTTPGFPSRVLRYVPGGTLEVAIADSGTNGLSLDPSGSALAGARHKSKSIVVFGASGDVEREVAKGYQALPFNSPNDLVFRSDGTLFFTDPDFQAGEHRDQATTNVYRVGVDGVVTVVDDTIKNPNGIALSLDERTLYVAGNLEQGYLKSYPVDVAGNVGVGSLLVPGIVVPDGLTLDCSGNIYVTEHTQKRVRVFSPQGQELGEIGGLKHNVTNVAFGGADRKTLYITTTGALYRLPLPTAGLPY